MVLIQVGRDEDGDKDNEVDEENEMSEVMLEFWGCLFETG